MKSCDLHFLFKNYLWREIGKGPILAISHPNFQSNIVTVGRIWFPVTSLACCRAVQNDRQ